MNTIASSEAPTRPAVVNRLKISRKSEERTAHSHAPLIDVVLPKAKKKPHNAAPPGLPGSFKSIRQHNQAAPRKYTARDEPPYKTGDGDVIYALRPGALDFKAIPSRTGFTS